MKNIIPGLLNSKIYTMKKIVLSIIILLVIPIFSYADTINDSVYIVFLRDDLCPILEKKDSIRIFRGEIYKASGKYEDKTRRFLFGKSDTVSVTYTTLGGKNYGKVIDEYNGISESIIDENQIKYAKIAESLISYIKIDNEKKYSINLAQPEMDNHSVDFIFSEKRRITYTSKGKEYLNIEESDEKFIRVLINQTPTIFIDKKQLVQSQEIYTKGFVLKNGEGPYIDINGVEYFILKNSRNVYKIDPKVNNENILGNLKKSEEIALKDGSKLLIENENGEIIAESLPSQLIKSWKIIIPILIFAVLIFVLIFRKKTIYKRLKSMFMKKNETKTSHHKLKKNDTIEGLEAKYNKSFIPSKEWLNEFYRLNNRLKSLNRIDIIKEKIKNHKFVTIPLIDKEFVPEKKENIIETIDSDNTNTEIRTVDKATDDSQLQNFMMRFQNQIETHISKEIRTRTSDLYEKIEMLIRSSENVKEVENINKQLKIELDKKKKELFETQKEKDSLSNERDELKKTFLKIENFDSFTSSNIALLNLIEEIEGEVLDFVSRAKQISPDSPETDIISQFVGKHYFNIRECKLGSWKDILTGMEKNKGMIIDLELSKKIATSKDSSNHLEILKNFIFYDIYKKYPGSLILLLEEIRNINFFTGNENAVTKEAEGFEHKISKLKNSLSNYLNFDIQYVPLFADFSKYSEIKALNENPGNCYRNLKLERNKIWEIISIGYRYETEEEKTFVILS